MMRYTLINEDGKEYLLKFDKLEEIEKAEKLTPEKYEEIKKPLLPLDKKYYVDQRNGSIFAQWHLRGILPEDYKMFKNGKKSFQDIILKRSLHEDLRYNLSGLKKLVQYVIVESSMESYIRMMKGELNPEQKGAPNVQKAKIVSKPSGEPTEEWLRTHLLKNDKKEGFLIDKKGAKIIDNYIIHNKSYWINPSEVGSTPYTYSYLGLIFGGKIKEGVQRQDLHELFIYPDINQPDINKKLFDGRFIIRCFRGDKRPSTWWIWKATKDQFGLNPYCSIDAGFHYLIPAKEIKYFGHESYPEWKVRKEICG